MAGLRLRLSAALLAVALAPGAASAVDVNGKWRFELSDLPGLPQIVQVTQAGSSISFTLFGAAFSGSLTPAGSFTNYSVTAPSVPAGMGGRIMPSGNLLDGWLGGGSPPQLSVAGVVAVRCTCDDGNTNDGDGCDAACQVEPCWTCAGDPSICSPTADGGACDDQSPCTSGETCSGGVCGGGTPV